MRRGLSAAAASWKIGCILARTRRNSAPGKLVQRLALEHDAPAVGLQQAERDAPERGLARSALADQRDGLPRRDAEADRAHRVHDLRARAPEGLADAGDFQRAARSWRGPGARIEPHGIGL